MGPLVLRVENALLKKHLRRQASRLGLEFGEFTDEKLESPKMLVAELEQPGLLEEVKDWKEKWPECFVAISVSEPDRELWIAAETAGADLVANRGALPRLIHERLKQLVNGQALVKKKDAPEGKAFDQSGRRADRKTSGFH